MFRKDLRRAMTSVGFISVILLTWFISTYEMWGSLFHAVFAMKVPWPQMGYNKMIGFFMLVNSSGVMFMFPLLCVVPFAVALSDEKESGFLRLAVYRTGRKRYMWTRMLSVCVSGGVACSLVVIILGITAYFAFPMKSDPIYYFTPEETMIFMNRISLLLQQKGMTGYESVHVYQYMVWQTLLAFIGGFILSSVSLGIAAWFSNRYFALAVPVVAYFAFLIINSLLKSFIPQIHQYTLFSDFSALSTWIAQIALRLGWLAVGIGLYSFSGRRLIYNA